MIEKLSPIQNEIVAEIAEIAHKLGANVGVLAALGSWGDTLPEVNVLQMLRDSNKRGVQ